MPNHQDNFATNMTSGISAGATTAPLNSIPSVAANFYLAFDATNVNGKYEIVLCTSKTATNVNFAACANDHTTAEEVRLISPARELDAIYQHPEGHLLNGKVVPSVASNNLTVAIKTLAGADPSVTDPVYCRIGDTVRSITSALSKTMNAGTNLFNAGSAELATKEIDYFVYFGWKTASSTVDIGIARVPYYNLVNDSGGSGSTTEKWFNAAGDVTDIYTVIGRFAATLSAGAGYTWSVPTFTASNLIQRPIYETRWLVYVPTLTGFSGSPTNTAYYQVIGRNVNIFNYITGTSNTTGFTYTLPFSSGSTNPGYGTETLPVVDSGTRAFGFINLSGGSPIITVFKSATSSTFTNSGTKGLDAKTYKINLDY